MRKLPHWVLTDKFPAFYDCESLTTIEQTARLYGAMQDLIDEYNKFVDSLNSELENYENGITEEISVFERGVNQKFDDFTKVIELMFNKQNLEVTETINYIKANTSAAVSGIIKEMRENGELSEAILSGLNIVSGKLAELDEHVTNLLEDTEENSNDLENAKERIEELESGLSERIEELENGLSENDSKTEELQQGLTDAKERIEALEPLKESVTPEGIRPVIYPRLTEAQKNEIKTLATDYYNNREVFYYYDEGNTRNKFADSSCYDDTKQKFRLNCSNFIQSVWMGRSITDFLNPTTYSSKITKAFDWGYYFKFEKRALAGVHKKDENGNLIGYYGFKRPNGAESDLSSYSHNSYYNENSTRLYHQSFRSFMDAGDMAAELRKMGCEIPVSELEVGDIVFTSSPIRIDNASSEFGNHIFKNITHVLMIYAKHETGELAFIDCTDFVNGETNAITYASQRSTYRSDILRANFTEENIVFCARHPQAFGKGGNVPEVIEYLEGGDI